MPILNADYSNINHEELALCIGLKPQYMPILIDSFLRESALMLDVLRESIVLRDYNKIKSNAHAIKGSAGNLRFNEVYEMAKEIEFAGAEQKIDFEYEAYFEAIKKAIDTILL